MPTTSGGIWYPGPGDQITPLENVFATMAASINDAMGVQVFASIAAMDTAYNARPFSIGVVGADYATGTLYVRNGTTWDVIVSTSTTDVSSGLDFSLDAAWTAEAYVFRRSTNTVYMYVRLRYSGATVTVGASGNITDMVVGILPTEWWPISPNNSNVAIDIQKPGVMQWFGRLQTDGKMVITHGIPGMSLVDTDAITFSGSYPI